MIAFNHSFTYSLVVKISHFRVHVIHSPSPFLSSDQTAPTIMKSLVIAFLSLVIAEASIFDILLRASSDCTIYTVGTGDTCTGIGKSQDVTWAQLLAWNSQIDSTCSYVVSPI